MIVLLIGAHTNVPKDWVAAKRNLLLEPSLLGSTVCNSRNLARDKTGNQLLVL